MKTKLERFGEKFIYYVLVLWISTEVLFNSNIEYFFGWKKNDANDVMAIIILLLLVLQILLFQRYSFKEIVIILLVSLPIILATLNSNNNLMMSTWIFVIASKYLDIDKSIKITYVVQLTMILLVVYMFNAGIIEETTIYRGNVLRHSLGFTHPNQLGIRVFQIILSRCYLRRDKINSLDFGLVALTAWFIKRVADSKTSFYAMIIMGTFLLAYKCLKRVRDGYNRFSDFMIAIFISSVFVSVLLSLINVKRIKILKTVDEVMSGRFWQCYRLYRHYGIEMFGQDVQLFVRRHVIGQVYRFWLDNAYMSILLRYGVVVFFMFLGLYFQTMIYLKKSQQHMLVAIFALYAIYGIMENSFFSMSQNVFLIVLSYPIYKQSNNLEEHRNKKVRFVL